MMLFGIWVLAFGAVGLLAWVFLRPKESVIARRINPALAQATLQDRRLEGGLGQRLLAPAGRRLGVVLARLMPHSMIQGIDRLLIMANQPMSLSAFLTLWAGTASLGFLLLAYLLRSGILPTFQLFAVGLVILPLSIFGPYVLLRRRVRRRQKRIFRDLPYALDMIVTTVEAGLGVDAAFAIVTEKTSGPISETFSRYLKEVGLGRARRDALTHAAERSGVPDLIRIAAAVAQAEEMGTTIGDVFRVQAEELRLIRRQRAQEAAQRAPVWMTIPLIFCFLPAMGAVIITPSVLNFLGSIGALGLRLGT